jgi:HlyD family secretion protein
MRKFLKKKFVIPFLLLLLVAGFFGYKALNGNKGETRYVLTQVQKGTLIVSVSGSGQISASNQIDLKSKVSSEVAAVFVKKGETVQTGKLLVKLDDADFQKALRDAQTSLETAQLELEELLKPADELSVLQAENSLAQAKQSKQKDEDDVEKGYEDGFNDVSNAFLELPSIMTGLQDVLFSYNFNTTQQNIYYYADAVKNYDEKVLQYKDDAYDKYQTARKLYDQNFQDYKSTSRFSDKSTIESLMSKTYETVKNIAEAVKSANNLIQFYQDKLTEHGFKPLTLSTTHLSSLNTYTSKTNSELSTILSDQRALQDNKEAVLDAQRTIEEKELSLVDLKAGATDLEIRAKKIVVQQKEDALSAAKQDLANCYVVAPFEAIVADAQVKKGDSASSGTVLATLITPQKIAEISLNEVDAAKVKVSQKATLTFDALPDLAISGQVLEIDTLGNVSQGVVSYGVKIVLDTQDERIKSGMSVAVDVITDVKQDVLVLPNSAVKSQGDSFYVELVEILSEEAKQQLLAQKSGVVLSSAPKAQIVQTGLSNDISTEIVSGLKEGDVVVSSTFSSNQTRTAQTQDTQRFGAPGGQVQMFLR